MYHLMDGLRVVKAFMPNKSRKKILTEVHNVWASVYGIIEIFRRSEWQGSQTEST